MTSVFDVCFDSCLVLSHMRFFPTFREIDRHRQRTTRRACSDMCSCITCSMPHMNWLFFFLLYFMYAYVVQHHTIKSHIEHWQCSLCYFAVFLFSAVVRSHVSCVLKQSKSSNRRLLKFVNFKWLSNYVVWKAKKKDRRRNESSIRSFFHHFFIVHQSPSFLWIAVSVVQLDSWTIPHFPFNLLFFFEYLLDPF